jgi:Acetyl-CoA dehydrogenase C-terminal like
VLRDGGAAIGELLAAIAADGRSAEASTLAPEAAGLVRAADEAGRAVQYLLAPGQTDPRLPFAGAVPFLHLMGVLVGAHMLMRGARAAETRIAAGDNDPYWAARIGLARFYAAHVLPQAGAQLSAVLERQRNGLRGRGGAAVNADAPELEPRESMDFDVVIVGGGSCWSGGGDPAAPARRAAGPRPVGRGARKGLRGRRAHPLGRGHGPIGLDRRSRTGRTAAPR